MWKRICCFLCQLRKRCGAFSHLSLYCFMSPPTNLKILGKFLFVHNLGRNDSILQFQLNKLIGELSHFPDISSSLPVLAPQTKPQNNSLNYLFQMNLAYFGLDWNHTCGVYIYLSKRFSKLSVLKECQKTPLNNYCSLIPEPACWSFRCDIH